VALDEPARPASAQKDEPGRLLLGSRRIWLEGGGPRRVLWAGGVGHPRTKRFQSLAVTRNGSVSAFTRRQVDGDSHVDNSKAQDSRAASWTNRRSKSTKNSATTGNRARGRNSAPWSDPRTSRSSWFREAGSIAKLPLKVGSLTSRLDLALADTRRRSSQSLQGTARTTDDVNWGAHVTEHLACKSGRQLAETEQTWLAHGRFFREPWPTRHLQLDRARRQRTWRADKLGRLRFKTLWTSITSRWARTPVIRRAQDRRLEGGTVGRYVPDSFTSLPAQFFSVGQDGKTTTESLNSVGAQERLEISHGPAPPQGRSLDTTSNSSGK